MKKLIILFLLLPIFCSAQYDSTKNLQSIDAYGYSWKNAAFRFSIRLPKDTTKLAVKDSGCLAVKSTSLFLWNGYKWVLAGGSSSSSSFVGVDSVVVKSSGCVDTFYQWKQGVRTLITTVDEQNGINSGGAVTVGANDTTFNVAAAVYKIGCVRYSSNAASLVLNGNSDSAKGRIDVIGVNTSGAVFAIQGQNLTNPIAPSLSATELGLATVYFPPLKDSGITNIYNNVNVNGIDSSAYISVATTPDSLCFIFTSRRRSDTICTTRGSGGGIDSLRRIGINVSALKNGTWRNQYTDSVGSGGGGSQNLDQTLAIGNNTDTTINFVDTLSANEGKQFVTIYPKGYGITGYPNGRPAMFSGLGYQRYPGVNADGRPNVVGLLWGYNGGFNTPTIANEATWGVRTETWYQIAGAGVSEFHGVMPEFKAIDGTSRRLGTAYVNNLNGYTTYNLGIDNMNVMRGASDTPQLASSINRLLVGFKGVGDISLKNQDSTTSSTQWILGLNGTSFNNNVSTGAQPNNAFSFNSVVSVAPGTSYGSSATYSGIINSNVAVAGKYGYVVAQTGLASSGFGGIGAPSINTSGQFDLIYGRNSGTGTIRAHLMTNTGGTASYVWSDQTTGQGWLASFRGGASERSLHFNSTSYDSAFSIRGTDGKAKFRNNLNVGDGTYPVASAALQVTSTTQGFLPPRMTATQGSAISSPAEGLIIYVTDTNGTFTAKGWWGWDGAAWLKLNN